MPREVVAVVEPLFRRYVERLPVWVNEVVLKWDSLSEPGDSATASTAMTATTLPEYRFVVLTVRPGFISMDDGMRDEAFRHELAHVAVEPLWDVARRLISQYEDESVRALLLEELRLAGEGCVEDLRMALDRATGVPTTGVPTAGVPTAGVPTAGVPTAGASSANGRRVGRRR